LLGRGQAEVTIVESGTAALLALNGDSEFDVVLIDIMMPVMDGYETIRAIRAINRFDGLPIIAITGKAAAGERQRCLDAGASDYVPKPVDKAELLAVLRPWLPTAVAERSRSLVVDRNGSLASHAVPALTPFGHAAEQSPIAGMKILVVDDDFRNIFAMTVLLERGRAEVVVAESGAQALKMLEATQGIDVVLMDIMMPVMDGYEAIAAIRAIEQFATLPIIAVTGKAAAGERQRCLDAGANEYVPKPVDTAALLAALRPWLPAIATSA
jgi:CheY-like chemotaxis protein